MEVDPEHGGAANHGAVARIERVDPGHRRGADALGQLIAITGRGRRQQVEQELRAPPGAVDRQLEHVRRHLARLGRRQRQRVDVLAR